MRSRLRHHNSGGNPHTAKYRPWRIKTAIAFTDREQALVFERDLKSPSGRAFAKKRLSRRVHAPSARVGAEHPAPADKPAGKAGQ